MKRISSMLFTLIFIGVSYSQENNNTSKYKPLFGLNFGLNQSAIYNSNAVDELQIKNSPGFRMGVFSEFRISERWAVSPKTELSFNYGRVKIKNIGYRVDPVNLDLMLHFKHKFKSYNGMVKPFINFGPNLRTPLNSNLKGIYLDTKVSLAADFGFGLQIELKHFYFSPELRFSGGLTDIRKNPSGNILRGSNTLLTFNFSGK